MSHYDEQGIETWHKRLHEHIFSGHCLELRQMLKIGQRMSTRFCYIYNVSLTNANTFTNLYALNRTVIVSSVNIGHFRRHGKFIIVVLFTLAS